jgi:hypothetical protein
MIFSSTLCYCDYSQSVMASVPKFFGFSNNEVSNTAIVLIYPLLQSVLVLDNAHPHVAGRVQDQ